jgi:nitronate monooxygenase
MIAALANLNLTNPVLAAPMAGGPSTPELVIAAARAGTIGFLGGGYKTAEGLAEQINAVRSQTEAFGVNLFAPNPLPVDPDAFRNYAQLIQPEADPYAIDLVAVSPIEDDDTWQAKIDLLLTAPVPLVSFTFAIPQTVVIEALRKAGTVVIQTVTSSEEARLAAAAGTDLLAVQGFRAGGHSGTFTPQRPPEPIELPDLIRQVRSAVTLPLIAAGGLSTSADVAAALHAGAGAAMVGTVLLRTDESGASPVYKAALAERADCQTVVTRAFTGRPARALPNLFTQRYDATAPSGYPAIHNLTSPLRRAATTAGDAERINLWAGTGHHHASNEPAASVLARLADKA